MKAQIERLLFIDGIRFLKIVTNDRFYLGKVYWEKLQTNCKTFTYGALPLEGVSAAADGGRILKQTANHSATKLSPPSRTEEELYLSSLGLE